MESSCQEPGNLHEEYKSPNSVLPYQLGFEGDDADKPDELQREAQQIYDDLLAAPGPLHIPTPPEKQSTPTLMDLPIKIVSKRICCFLKVDDLWRLAAVNTRTRILLRHLPETLSISDYDYVNNVSAGDVTTKGTRVWSKDDVEEKKDSTDDRSAVDLGHHLCVQQAVRGGVPSSLRNRLYCHIMRVSGDFQNTVIKEVTHRSHVDAKTFSKFYDTFRLEESDNCHFAANVLAMCEEECQEIIEKLKLGIEREAGVSKDPMTEDNRQSANGIRRRQTSLPADREILQRCSDTIKTMKPHHEHEMTRLFEFIKRHGNVSTALHDLIDRDLDRTFPNHPLFRYRTGCLIKKAMKEILVAVALLEPTLGYCQGMNFIAGALLSELLCPTTAFWTLMYLLRQRSLIGLFTPGVSAMSAKLMQLKEIIRLHVPDTYMSFKRAGISLDLLCHQSLVTSLTYFLHPTVVINFWDAVMLGGSRVSLVVTLSILCLLERRVLRDFTVVHKSVSDEQAERDSLNSEELIKASEVEQSENLHPLSRHCRGLLIDEPLQLIQDERLRVSQLYIPSVEGERYFKELVGIFLKYYSKCTNQLLSRLSSISLVTTLREMVITLHNALKESAHAKLPSPQTKLQKHQMSFQGPAEPHGSHIDEPEILEEGIIEAPYLLVPKLPGFCTDTDDPTVPRGMLVHFIASAESAKSFKFSLRTSGTPHVPSESASEDIKQPSASKLNVSPDTPAKLTWSLLIPEQSKVNAEELRLVHGGGRLKASSFYVILDAKYYLNEEKVPILSYDDDWADDSDALTEYLLRKHLTIPTVDNIANIPFKDMKAYLKDVEEITVHGSASVKRSGISTAENLVALKAEAILLLDWLKKHDVVPDSTPMAVAKARAEQEGFLIIPLKVLITLIHVFREKRKQFIRDREHFESKVSNHDRQINALIRQIDRLRQRHSQQIKIVSQLEQDLHEHLSRTPKASPTKGAWKRLLTWKAFAKDAPKSFSELRPERKIEDMIPSPTELSPEHSLANAVDGRESPDVVVDDAITERAPISNAYEVSPVISAAKTDGGLYKGPTKVRFE